MGTNGSWSGKDPRLRQLRVVATLVLLGLLVFIVLDPADDPVTTVGMLVGALLVVLGFEAGVAYPKGGPKE